MIKCEEQVMFTVSVVVMQPSSLCGRTLKPLPNLHDGCSESCNDGC